MSGKEKKLYRVEKDHIALCGDGGCSSIVISHKDVLVIRDVLGGKVTLNSEEYKALRQVFIDGVL